VNRRNYRVVTWLPRVSQVMPPSLPHKVHGSEVATYEETLILKAHSFLMVRSASFATLSYPRYPQTTHAMAICRSSWTSPKYIGISQKWNIKHNKKSFTSCNKQTLELLNCSSIPGLSKACNRVHWAYFQWHPIPRTHSRHLRSRTSKQGSELMSNLSYS
jgi:hypothetical protein